MKSVNSHQTGITTRVNVVISSPLECHYVDQIAAVDPRIQVLYEPDLLPTARYVSDHVGDAAKLTTYQLEQWRELTRAADVSFDFDRRFAKDFNQFYPRVRWIQATSSGLGQVLDEFPVDFTKVTVTTAAGVHGEPLAEFVLASVLYFVKRFPELRRWQAEHRWTRYTSRSLLGQRALVVGLGHVGRRTAEMLTAAGMEVIGAVRSIGSSSASTHSGASELIAFDSILDVLPTTDYLVLCCPLTAETTNLINAECIDAMRPGAVLINIARGGVLDESALERALKSGRMGGAALDTTAIEPLPRESALWDMGNVLISPHSASTVVAENQRITDLFCENLRRWLRNDELVNVYDPARGY